MKKLLLVALLCVGFAAKSQTVTLTAIGFVDSKDSTKNYVVIDAPGVKGADIYRKTMTYLNTAYHNQPLAIKENPFESIIIDAVTNKVYGDNEYYKYDFKYLVKLLFKDGKVRFEPSMEYLIENPAPSPRRKVFLKNTDSDKPGEINSIFYKSKKDGFYYPLDSGLQKSLTDWANSLLKEIQKSVADNW